MTCDKILSFTTKKEAKVKAKQIFGKGGSDVKLIPYFCEECKEFHLTSKTSMDYKIKVRSR